jgi:hypothetical protein
MFGVGEGSTRIHPGARRLRLFLLCCALGWPSYPFVCCSVQLCLVSYQRDGIPFTSHHTVPPSLPITLMLAFLVVFLCEPYLLAVMCLITDQHPSRGSYSSACALSVVHPATATACQLGTRVCMARGLLHGTGAHSVGLFGVIV